MMAALIFGLSLHRGPSKASDRAERAVVSMFLYGQSDPDTLVAAGLHGLGGRTERIELRRLARCRFTVATADRAESIDFDRIADVRLTLMADPAAGLARIISHERGNGRSAPPQLAVAVLTGSEDAMCGAQSCVGRRVFALSDPGRLDEARAAARAFRDRVCPGK